MEGGEDDKGRGEAILGFLYHHAHRLPVLEASSSRSVHVRSRLPRCENQLEPCTRRYSYRANHGERNCELEYQYLCARPTRRRCCRAVGPSQSQLDCESNEELATKALPGKKSRPLAGSSVAVAVALASSQTSGG